MSSLLMSAWLLLGPVNVCISASRYTPNIQTSQFSDYFSCLLNSIQKCSPAVQQTAAERSALAGLGKCISPIRNQSGCIYSPKWVPGKLSEHCKSFVNACIFKNVFRQIFYRVRTAQIVILTRENYPQRTAISTFSFLIGIQSWARNLHLILLNSRRHP